MGSIIESTEKKYLCLRYLNCLNKSKKCFGHEFVNYNVHLFMIDVRYCGWFHNYGHFYLKLDLRQLKFLAHETNHNLCSINMFTF